VVGVALIVVGIGVGLIIVLAGLASLDDKVAGFARIQTPSVTDVILDEGGTYTIYEEGIGLEVDGETPLGITVERIGGDEIDLDLADADVTYDSNGRSGAALFTFDAPGAGTYRFTVEGSLDAAAEQLAVGRSVAGDFIEAIVIGVVVGGAITLIGVIVLIVGFVIDVQAASRRRSGRSGRSTTARRSAPVREAESRQGSRPDRARGSLAERGRQARADVDRARGVLAQARTEAADARQAATDAAEDMRDEVARARDEARAIADGAVTDAREIRDGALADAREIAAGTAAGALAGLATGTAVSTVRDDVERIRAVADDAATQLRQVAGRSTADVRQVGDDVVADARDLAGRLDEVVTGNTARGVADAAEAARLLAEASPEEAADLLVRIGELTDLGTGVGGAAAIDAPPVERAIEFELGDAPQEADRWQPAPPPPDSAVAMVPPEVTASSSVALADPAQPDHSLSVAGLGAVGGGLTGETRWDADTAALSVAGLSLTSRESVAGRVASTPTYLRPDFTDPVLASGRIPEAVVDLPDIDLPTPDLDVAGLGDTAGDTRTQR
jgi:hypothetical protein